MNQAEPAAPIRSLWLECVCHMRQGYVRPGSLLGVVRQRACEQAATVLLARSFGVRHRQLAVAFGVTPARIRQIEHYGVRELRRMARMRRLIATE